MNNETIDLKSLNKAELWVLLESVPASQVRLITKIREALDTLLSEQDRTA